MAYWEFLLQKEGDRDWLPLETAHVEISEGRYRIIAHTSFRDAAADIRLSRLLTSELPPRRKTLKRSGTTNENGLMVVIPFTHLTPGLWTLTCSAATASETPWKYRVEIQVLAIESGVEYWDTELDEANLAESFTSDGATQGIGAESPPSPPTTPSQTSIGDVGMVDPNAAFGDRPSLEDLPLRLQLKQQALVAQADSPVQIQGQVTTFSQVEGLATEGTLWMQLRNPETGAVVHQTTRAISTASLPSRFEMEIVPPANIASRLLVGELSLWTAFEPAQVLAIQGFTLTLNLDELLETVANQAERSPTTPFEELATSPSDTPEGTVSDAETGIETAATLEKGVESPPSREIPFRLIYLPSSGLTLPPVIYRPIDKKTVGAPTLPPFAAPTTSPQTQQTTQPASQAQSPPQTKPLTLPPIGSASGSTNRPSTTPPAGKQAPGPQLELPKMGRSLRPTEEPAPSPASAEPSSPAATSQQAAPPFEPDFQGRFWNRLSALAEEAQKTAADYKAQVDAAGVETAQPQFSENVSPSATDNSPPNYEVVVYETEAVETEGLAGTEPSEPIIEVLQPEVINADALGTVPKPEWIFPQGELVAGAPLPITLRLPAYPRRLAVKVWVTDIQSRTLVDRPRWLMNWTPTPEGDQTAFLQLQVPLGSIEARFEAIAVDLATQQESYKTSLIREIVTSPLPEQPAQDDAL